MKKCNLCYKLDNVISCKTCGYNCCKKCIERWAYNSLRCPHCREYKSYDFDYTNYIEKEYKNFGNIFHIEYQTHKKHIV